MPENSNWDYRVARQLKRLLSSAEFKKSKRLRKFLQYVVAETLAGASVIRSYNIAVEVFEKGVGFDPNDPYVRNIARHARKALSNYYENADENDEIRIDVPAGNYVATFALLSSESCSANVGHEVAVASLNYPAAEATNKSGCEEGGLPNRRSLDISIPTIAVIPFKFLGLPKADESVIGEMIAESTISTLVTSPHFNVISRLSTTRFRNMNWTLGMLSRQLGSDYVMSGSYRCSKNRVLVFVELSDCGSGEVIWADNLSCTVNELVQHEDTLIERILHETTRAVLVHEIERASTEPFQTLALHTQMVAGLHDMHSTCEKRFSQSRRRFEDILSVHPSHTTVKARIAHWHVIRLNRNGGWKMVENRADRALAEACLQSAMEANPRHSLVLTIAGLVETQFKNNPEKGLALYDLAERINPNQPLLMACKAAILSYQGKAQEAVHYANRAIKLSPFDPQLGLFHTCAAAAYYAADQFEHAEQHAEKAFALNPSHTSNLRTLVAIKVDLGKEKEAQVKANELLSIDPGFTTGSYLNSAPTANYTNGRKIARRLEFAGVPAA